MGNSVFIAASVDGFIARKDGSLDWLTKIENPEKTDYGFQAFMDRMDAVVMGRKTFESIENFEPWPYSKPVFVLSGTLNPAEKNKPGVRIMNKSPKELVSDLNRQGLNNLYIDGGKTIQGFLTENLIDELIITRIPILLGSGIPLFGNDNPELKLRHIRTESFQNGLIQSTYRKY